MNQGSEAGTSGGEGGGSTWGSLVIVLGGVLLGSVPLVPAWRLLQGDSTGAVEWFTGPDRMGTTVGGVDWVEILLIPIGMGIGALTAVWLFAWLGSTYEIKAWGFGGPVTKSSPNDVRSLL